MGNLVGNQMGAVIASVSFPVGGNWGYVLSKHPDYAHIQQIITTNADKLKVVHVSNGMVVFCEPQFLYDNISQVDEVTPEDFEKVQMCEKKELAEFEKFVGSILSHTCKYGERVDGALVYNIGILSSNDTHSIRLEGTSYPAFKLNLIPVLNSLLYLEQGYNIEVYTTTGFVPMSKLQSNVVSMADVLSALEISNTLTGVFLTIRLTERGV